MNINLRIAMTVIFMILYTCANYLYIYQVYKLFREIYYMNCPSGWTGWIETILAQIFGWKTETQVPDRLEYQY